MNDRRPELLTFDCYGTLIDWEAGIVGALRAQFPEARERLTEELLDSFHEVQDRLKRREYRSYRELLAQVSEALAADRGWSLPTEAREFVAESLPSWAPFADTNPALDRLEAAGYRLGILSNIDNDLLAGSLRHLSARFHLLVTAEDLRSYKPAPHHFRRALANVDGDPQRLVHVAQSLFHDVIPATRLGLSVVWVNRKKEPRPPEAQPIAEVADLAGAARWLDTRLGPSGAPSGA